MEQDGKIYIAGIHGMVGSAIARALKAKGYRNIIGHTSKELDLTNQAAVTDFFSTQRPEYVFLAAARVGGIYANNTYPAEFIYKNLQIQNNIIHAAYSFAVKRLLFLGSSCIYPKLAPQPLREDYLLTGPLEPTNEAYAIAKIAGLKMCEYYNKQYGTDFFSVMPTNLYGPGDNYDPMNSHVLPALIRRFDEARMAGADSVILWGTGKPLREFLYVEDLADACIFLMQRYNTDSPINVGSGYEVSISELANIVAKVTGFTGKIIKDVSKPDGTPRKLLDLSRINQLGWKATTNLQLGIEKTYASFKSSLK